MLASLVAVGASGVVLFAPLQAQAAPEGMAYEMVSPPAKYNGGVVFGQRASDDGDAIAFIMNAATGGDAAAYALAPYVARRGATGWETLRGAPHIRSEFRGSGNVQALMVDFNDDFSSIVLRTNDRIDPADMEAPASRSADFGYDFYRFGLGTDTGTWLSRPIPSLAAEYAAGGNLSTAYAGQSRDGEHVFFLTTRRLTADAPNNTSPKLYEAFDGAVRLVSVRPDGTPLTTQAFLGTSTSTRTESDRGTSAISDDGARVFWSGGIIPRALYVRENGNTTIPISVSQRTGSVGTLAAGDFLAASRDGSIVYFSSFTQLTDDATAGGGVYRYELDSGDLTFLARGATTNPAMASDDGSRLYFLTTATPTPEGQAGASNLYLWDDGQLRFVAATGTSAPVSDPRLNVSRDGRFVVFTSRRQIDLRHADGVNQVYRYDAQADEVSCASCRPDGEVTEGEARMRPSTSRYAILASPALVAPRNMSVDGRVFFETDEPLVTADRNGSTDVYSFDGTDVTLISSGTGDGSDYVDNSEDGDSVFFSTAESLLPHDHDGGYPDIYVARTGGGFPFEINEQTPCREDACQGSPTAPPLISIPGSAQTAPDESGDEPAPRSVTFRLTRPSAKQRLAFARRGRITLRVGVSARGTVTAVARARVGKRVRGVGKGWAVASRRGSVRLTIPLNRAVRSRLGRRGVAVTVVVRHSAADTSKRMNLRLRRGAR
ncbi:TolB family protein [Conexibacter arvalis]|uniref:WD40-like Beta Propeller Repeat n=1 Tax=Conexibacter arvalis TaxID=912552 RepID=A0A840IK71_9ACTN|nr:hypothetical protein [Conexibacter arvalis]MBB4664330.1 hypothetical protein [Conexibacter arvalis]